jgi:hypothetical protein
MPHLLNFLTSNGTVLSNTHTPLIAHTADDSLTIYTGLYGDRHGQPVSNSYKTFNPDGSSDPAGSFAYPVTDAAGNRTDLDVRTLVNSFAGKPGFPGFSPTATQSLAYLADMQESGIPVTDGYISDLHDATPA